MKSSLLNISNELISLRNKPKKRIVVIILSFVFAFLTFYLGKISFSKLNSGESKQFFIGILLIILSVACLALFLEYTIFQISNFFYGIRTIRKGVNTKLGITCIIFNLIYLATIGFGLLYLLNK